MGRSAGARFHLGQRSRRGHVFALRIGALTIAVATSNLLGLP